MKSIPLRLELLELVDDVVAALVLQQLCYLSSRSRDPLGWIVRTYDELSAEFGSTRSGKPSIPSRTVRRRVAELEALGLIQCELVECATGRFKRYRLNREIRGISEAAEASKGPSSIVHFDGLEATGQNGQIPTGQNGQTHGGGSGQNGQTPPAKMAAALIRELEDREHLACMHNVDELGEDIARAFDDVGRGLGGESNSTRADVLGVLLESVGGVGAPLDYLPGLVRDIGERNPRARARRIAEMASEDIAARKWLADPVWNARRLEQLEAELDAGRRARIAEQDAKWEAAELRREALWEAVSPRELERWSVHFRAMPNRRDADDDAIREWTLDELESGGVCA